MVSLAGLYACNAQPGFVTGGGWLPSADRVSGDKANFGFNAQQCDLSQPGTGHFNYNDHHASGFQPLGVDINGSILDVGLCVPPFNGSTITTACTVCESIFGNTSNLYGIDESYTSKNPNFRGTGTAVVCAIDNGEGFHAKDDEIAVVIGSGPFTGYSNVGQSEGNIQAQLCP